MVMAMAWSGNAVAHAWADVIVRDPVVVTLRPPWFLRLYDSSRLLRSSDHRHVRGLLWYFIVRHNVGGFSCSTSDVHRLALQLHCLLGSESMGNHDSEPDDWWRID